MNATHWRYCNPDHQPPRYFSPIREPSPWLQLKLELLPAALNTVSHAPSSFRSLPFPSVPFPFPFGSGRVGLDRVEGVLNRGPSTYIVSDPAGAAALAKAKRRGATIMQLAATVPKLLAYLTPSPSLDPICLTNCLSALIASGAWMGASFLCRCLGAWLPIEPPIRPQPPIRPPSPKNFSFGLISRTK